MAIAIILPISASPLADMVPTWAISLFCVTVRECRLRSATTALTASRCPASGPWDWRRRQPSGLLHARWPGREQSLSWFRHRPGRWSSRPPPHHLRAHVLELVLKLDLLGDSDAVLGRTWRAKGLLNHDIAPFWALRDFDSIGKDIDALQHSFPGLVGEFHFLGRHELVLRWVRPRASDKPMGSTCHAAKRHGSASIAQLE